MHNFCVEEGEGRLGGQQRISSTERPAGGKFGDGGFHQRRPGQHAGGHVGSHRCVPGLPRRTGIIRQRGETDIGNRSGEGIADSVVVGARVLVSENHGPPVL